MNHNPGYELSMKMSIHTAMWKEDITNAYN
jgi:hypothetical protein